MLLLTAIVASLLACGAPGTRGDATPVLGPYAFARTNVAAPVRVDVTRIQNASGGAAVLRETRRMCDLRGGKGSC
jgi:hypothetical protein